MVVMGRTQALVMVSTRTIRHQPTAVLAVKAATNSQTKALAVVVAVATMAALAALAHQIQIKQAAVAAAGVLT
jgi:hypothetical protein